MATLDTRAPKGSEAGPAGVAAWGAARVDRLLDMIDDVEAAAAAAVTGQQLGHKGPDVEGRPVAGFEQARVMAAALEDVQSRYAIWTIGNLTAALDRRLGDARSLGVPAEQRPAGLENLAREALRLEDVVRVSAPDPVVVPPELQRTDGGSIYRRANGERYATAEHLAREDHLLSATQAPNAPSLDGPSAGRAESELIEAGLTSDQTRALLGILTSGRAGDLLIGPAGAGKSRTVGQLAHVWNTEVGGRVLGVATQPDRHPQPRRQRPGQQRFLRRSRPTRPPGEPATTSDPATW